MIATSLDDGGGDKDDDNDDDDDVNDEGDDDDNGCAKISNDAKMFLVAPKYLKQWIGSTRSISFNSCRNRS